MCATGLEVGTQSPSSGHSVSVAKSRADPRNTQTAQRSDLLMRESARPMLQ